MLTKNFCTSNLPHALVFGCAFDSVMKFKLVIPSFFLSRFTSKHNDKHNKTQLGALIYFGIVSSLTNNEVMYFELDKTCDRRKLDTSTDYLKKQKQKQNKICRIGFKISHKL